MKTKLLIGIFNLLIMAGMACSPTAENDEPVLADAQSPKIEWTTTTHDFGKIRQNEPVNFDFEFSNSGPVPLIITQVRASCGCTGAKATEEPIKPDEKSTITASYDAKKVGAFTKTITVSSNTASGSDVLTIKGEVVAATE